MLSVNCLATAGGMIAVIQPGGFELHALANLHITAQAIRERVNPELHVLGAGITNAHPRPRLPAQVCLEVSRIYPLFNTIRAEARLLYATTAGAICRLTTFKTMDDYAEVVEQLRRSVLP